MAGELDKVRRVAKQRALDVQKRDDELIAQLDRLSSAAPGRAFTSAQKQVAKALATRDQLHIRTDLIDAIRALDPVAAIAGLEREHPIVLLPVRIETRFRKAGTKHRLLVRIYPDQVHQNSHEPHLTDAEAASGIRYWTESDEPAAWAQLVAGHGATRAAWIRRATDPSGSAPATSPSPFTRAPRTDLLPDRFWCVAYRSGQEIARQVGKPVRDALAVGPDPTATPGPDGLDDASRWLADFAESDAAGMAITLDLGSAANPKVDLLIVYGVKASLPPNDAAARLAVTLDAHHYSDGLGLVPAGTATNNSSGHADPIRSGWSSTDAVTAEASHRVEVEPSPVTTPAPTPAARAAAFATDGARLAAALGIPADHLAHVAGAGATSDLDARAMLIALWPGIGAYGLRQFLSESVPESLRETLRAHAADWVRARGPLPTLRVGRQPYGVLPVTSLRQFAPDSALAQMHAGVLRLQKAWLEAAGSVPRIGVGDPAKALSEILGLSPVSLGYRVRREADAQLLGLVGALADVPSQETATLYRLHGNLVSASLKALGKLAAGDRLATLLGFDDTPRLGRALVQEGALSATDPLTDNYVRFLRTATPGDILGNPIDKGTPLLRMLLRASVLSQYLSDGAQLAAFPDPHQLLDHFVVVDLPGAGPHGVLNELLHTPLPDPVPPDVLGGLPGVGDVIKAVIDRAGGLPTLQLDQPFGTPTTVGGDGTVVWPGGTGPIGQPADLPPGAMAGRAGLAATGPLAGPGGPAEGAHAPRMIAGLAAPAARATATPAPTARADTARVTTRPTTPELATTIVGRLPDRVRSIDLGIVDMSAALAHLEEQPTASLDRLLRETLDLGAHRLDAWVASFATRRLGELRSKQPTGVHLGAYAFVHDLQPQAAAGNAGFVHAPSIQHAATAAVLRSGHIARGGGDELAIDLSSARVRTARRILDAVRNGQRPGEVLGALLERSLAARSGQAAIGPARIAAPLAGSVGAGAVPGACDGDTLLNAVAGGTVTAQTLVDQSGVPGGQRTALRNAVDAALTELADAADAVADLLMAESVHQLASRNLPRSLAAIAAASGGRPPDEYDIDRVAAPGVGFSQRFAVLHRGPAPAPRRGTARSLLDPVLEGWAANLLGPFSAATLVTTLDDGTQVSVSLAATHLDALDTVALSAPATSGAVPPLVVMLGELASTAIAGRAVTSTDTSGIDRFAARARAIGRVLASARAFDMNDVPGSVGVDIAAVRGRVTAAIDLAGQMLAVADQVVAATAATAGELRSALGALVRGGVTTAIPVVPPGTDREAELLAEQLGSVAGELRHRRDQAVAAMPPTGVTDDVAVTELRTAAGALVAERVPLTLPLSAQRLDDLLDRPPTVGAGTVAERRRAARALLADAALVRTAAADIQRLRNLLIGHGDDPPALDLRQLVTDQPANEPWAGLADPGRAGDPHGAISGGRVSVLTLDAGLPVDPTQPTSGLVLDEWSETVPAPMLTTALAVHANRPSNEAPQAILLAVPPDPATGWSQPVLEAVINETFELARIRAVDLPALPAFGHVVPMLHIPIAGLSFNKGLRYHDFVGRPR